MKATNLELHQLTKTEFKVVLQAIFFLTVVTMAEVKTESFKRNLNLMTNHFVPTKRMKMEEINDRKEAEVAAAAANAVEVATVAATTAEVEAVTGVKTPDEKSSQAPMSTIQDGRNENKNVINDEGNSHEIDMVVEIPDPSTQVPATVKPVITVEVTESKAPSTQNQDLSESFDDFFRAINDETERRARHDYHMLIFDDDAFDGNARPTKAEAKRATVVERIEAPKRQLKKPLARRDIFYIVYLLCTHLNCRSTLQLMHLSAPVNRNIRILWHMVLPFSLKQYLHSPPIIRLFSGMKESTWEQRCMVLKSYFDENLNEICECIRNNFDIIRYIFSVCHAEVYYSSDDGLEITKRMGELDAELWMHSQNRPIQPYDVISTNSQRGY